MEPLNFLYLLGPLHLSHWQNNEIRYSLRSVDKTFPVGFMGITGPEVPEFLSGITHIQVDILQGISRYQNMQRQILAACTSSSVPEKLILMNDDFLVRSTPEWDWTPTYTGPILPRKRRQLGNAWKQTVTTTGEWLRSKGIANPICYEGHTPMPFLKSLAKPILEELIVSPTPLQFRSAYGNLVGVGGKLHPNAKRPRAGDWPAESPFWSLRGRLPDETKIFLETWLTEPSRWENLNG